MDKEMQTIFAAGAVGTVAGHIVAKDMSGTAMAWITYLTSLAGTFVGNTLVRAGEKKGSPNDSARSVPAGNEVVGIFGFALIPWAVVGLVFFVLFR